MARTRWMLVMFLAMALAPFACAQAASQPKRHKSRKPVKQLVLPPLPPGPLPQVPLDQLSSVPPQVSYQNGTLTIVAENSTLGDILRDVRKKTGASFDIPGNANERVATRLGPGPARDVLATLLNGTSFNYVMVGSPNDPTALSNLVLTAKPTSGATETAQNQPAPVYTAPDFGPGTGRPGFVPPQPAQAVQTAENADDKDDEEADEQDQEQQAEGQPQPGVQQLPQVQQPDQTDPNGQPNAGPRTPQQILQLLQQQKQQYLQQQQQQQQNQGEQPPQQQ